MIVWVDDRWIDPFYSRATERYSLGHSNDRTPRFCTHISPTLTPSQRPELTVASIWAGLVVGMRAIGQILVTIQ